MIWWEVAAAVALLSCIACMLVKRIIIILWATSIIKGLKLKKWFHLAFLLLLHFVNDLFNCLSYITFSPTEETKKRFHSIIFLVLLLLLCSSIVKNYYQVLHSKTRKGERKERISIYKGFQDKIPCLNFLVRTARASWLKFCSILSIWPFLLHFSVPLVSLESFLILLLLLRY